jgi:3-oxoacyl-[acyl-carrier protein] reductase
VRFFVTGGSQGLGAQFVVDAVEAGHEVAFTYLTSEAAAVQVVARAGALAPHVRCRAYPLDVRDSSAVERVADRVLADFDQIDAVVCNAGINRVGFAAHMSDQDWRDVIDTNLTGAFFVCREFLPPFLAQRSGRFIFISSVGMSGTTGQVGYSASKAGLMGLAQGLAKEYGAKNITSNALVLGLFDTPLSRATTTGKSVRFWTDICPARRLGRLSEFSGAVLFLASDRASFINGQMLHIDGGLPWVP